MSKLYYMQDSRSFVGNDMLWWIKGGAGYTTDISKAHIYTLEDAKKQQRMRNSDVPWPKEYIDANTKLVVDMQDVDIDSSLDEYKS